MHILPMCDFVGCMVLILSHVFVVILYSQLVLVNCVLQMQMNVLKVLTAVITLQLATTLKGITPALAILVTQAMVFHVLVSAVFSNHNISVHNIPLYS